MESKICTGANPTETSSVVTGLFTKKKGEQQSILIYHQWNKNNLKVYFPLF